MHQTFYIDIDEEITSIVDRLRKSKSKEIVIVVPKRALLIQSIVNLKLLKKEADGLRKKLIIVTQDKLGKMLIEKTGIEVEQKLDDVTGWEVAETMGSAENDAAEDVDLGENLMNIKSKKDFRTIGSDGYYQSGKDDQVVYSEKRSQDIFRLEESEERIINRELVVDVSDDIRKQQASFKKNMPKESGYAPMDMIRNVEIMENAGMESEMIVAKQQLKPKKDPAGMRNFQQEKLEEESEESFEDYKEENERIEKADIFFKNKKTADKSVYEHQNIKVGGNAGRYFFLFTAVAILSIAGLAAYLFLPKASIHIFAKNKFQSIETQIDGHSVAGEVDFVNEIIPVKTVTLTDEISKTYDATGAKDFSNQKARGMITIYNEFSTTSQPLVATTRFESTDKKIFRLVNAVVIPGMEKVGAENKPGAIEVEVIADESGESYNIEPTSFTIPGFESSGGEKYTKIYAKSFKAMLGGGQSGQKIKTVSENDINSAKTKATQELKAAIVEKLKSSVEKDYVFLEDAISVEGITYTTTKSIDDMADNFSITVKANASAIIFKENDVRALMARAIAKKGKQGAKIAENSIKLEFGKTDVNFSDGGMVIRVHATGGIVPEIDLGKIKQDLLGKNEDEIRKYLDEHNKEIEKIEVVYWPSQITSKVPLYEDRVDVILEQI